MNFNDDVSPNRSLPSQPPHGDNIHLVFPQQHKIISSDTTVEPQQKVRFGLIGYGAWGSHHARAIRESPNAELVAIAARSAESQASACSNQPDVEVVDDYRKLLDRTDIDVMDVVVPTHSHFEIADAALRAGKHLLLEKPMARTTAEGQQIVTLANEHKRLLAVGFELRLSRLWGRLKHMIDEGAIGEPLYCLIELWRKPYRLGSQGWRYDISRVGNWILEEPIHFFDLARWYLQSLGEPCSVTARANARSFEHPELTDNFSAIIDFPRGGYAVISQTLCGFEHHQVAKVTGRKGALWASWSGAADRTFTPQFSLRYHDGENAHEIDCGGPAGEVFELVEQIGCVASAIRNGTPLHADGNDGLWAMKMCELAAQAASENRAVPILRDTQ